MKKLTKVLAMVSAGFLAVGIVICIAGALLGATLGEFRSVVYSRSYSRDLLEGSADTISSKEISFTNISDLDIDIEYCRIEIEEYDGEEIIVDIIDSLNSIKYSEEDGTLKIKQKFKTKFGISGFNFNTDDMQVVMYIPKGQIFDEIDIEIGAGSLEGSGLSAKEMDLKIGAGEIALKGDVNGDVTIECGAGNIELYLTGKEEDYNYKIQTGAGNISIDDNSYSGLATNRKINNNADNDFSIQCGVGNIEIYFDLSN